MRPLAVRISVATEWQRLLACEPYHGKPAADQRSLRDRQIVFEAARAIEPLQYGREPREAVLVQCKAGTRQGGGKALPEVAGIDRVAIVPDIDPRQKLELVEVIRLPDELDLAPQGGLFHERAR